MSTLLKTQEKLLHNEKFYENIIESQNHRNIKNTKSFLTLVISNHTV